MPKTSKRKNELRLKKPRLGVMPKMSMSARNKCVFITLFIVAYAIFFLIFKDKLPFTPDFGSSDAFHSNVSFKYYLWQSIRSGIIPFWTDRLAGGFPIIAETQIGAFFLPQYIIFPLFSIFSHAYIFLFAFHLFLLSAGMFLLLTTLQIPSALSFLLALTFTWSGAITFRWVHFNFLQVFSLGPLLFWLYFNWKANKKKRYLFFISFLICQMIFAGHMQTTFILILGLIATHLVLHYPFALSKSIHLLGSIILGFILAAPQIIPTIQFSGYSARSFMNSYQYVVSFLFNSRDLIGFYSSKAYGTPLNANYGSLLTAGNRIYWENTPYMGELFIIGLFFASIYYFLFLKKQLHALFFLVLSVIFLLLSFGSDSPFYFLFGIVPFNMFRTPSRYLLSSIIFLILYSSYVFKEVISKKTFLLVLTYTLLAINCLILIRTAFDYHLFIDAQRLLKTLTTYSNIDKNSNYFVSGGGEAWYNYFTKKGWSKKEDIDTYLFLNSALLPNSNLISGLSVFDVYTGGLKMRRSEYLKSIITDSLDALTQIQDEPDASIKFEKLLQLYNIGTIISFKPLNLPHFTQRQSKKMGSTAITIWQNAANTNNIFYVPTDVKSVSYLEDVEKEIALETVSEQTALAESLPVNVVQKDMTANIQITEKNDLVLKAIITTSKNTYLVTKKGWYPEWHLYIDGKEHQIYKTNLIHMGFFIPKGKHVVEIVFIPRSFYIGCLISIFGFLLVVVAYYIGIRKNPSQS